MKKVLKLEDLDCAICANKMEVAINKIEGVKGTVSFMSQRMTLEIADGYSYEDIITKVIAICKKVEPDCKIGA